MRWARRGLRGGMILPLLLAAPIGGIGAQAGPTANAVANAPAFDKARLARLDAVLQGYIDSNQVAGLVAMVLQDGRPVYSTAKGWADREAKRPMRADHLFRIASQSKAFTSAAILILQEEGKLVVSEPVSKYIPAFAKTRVAITADSSVPARRAITIRDLLTHTAGISYGTDRKVAEAYRAKNLGPTRGLGGWYTADLDEPVCTTMERVATLPFVAQPGETFVYGYNTDILGCVVERASGMPLDQFIAARITGPLGLKDTRFFVPVAERDRLVAVYRSDSTRHAERAPDGPTGQGDYVDGPRRNFAGGAGLTSSARDYARFLETIRRGGAIDGVRIMSPATARIMHTNMTGGIYAAYTGEAMGFGYGFEVTEKFGANGMQTEGAYGWGGAYGSWYRVDPTEGLVLVLMHQTMPNRTDLNTKFPILVYQALVHPRHP